MATVSTEERATEAVLVKFTPRELEAINRLAARMGLKRTVVIKRFMAAVVKRSDAEATSKGKG